MDDFVIGKIALGEESSNNKSVGLANWLTKKDLSVSFDLNSRTTVQSIVRISCVTIITHSSDNATCESTYLNILSTIRLSLHANFERSSRSILIREE